MPTFRFGKLVRDKIVDHQLASGAKPQYRKLSDAEHKQELIKKIVEESQEILHAGQDEIAAEIADVQQALDDLKEKLGLTSQDIAAAQQRKNEKNGAFKKGIYIDTVEVDESDNWVAHFRENAGRYPEIQ